MKLHIGGSQAKDGWTVLNVSPGDHVDHVGNCTDLSFLADGSCEEVYASHVLEHLGYNGELQGVLKELFRILQPGGRVRISVPDMETLCKLFLHPQLKAEDRFFVMRMMFGGRSDEHDIHYVGLTGEFLDIFLRQAGFLPPERVKSFGEFEDTSDMVFMGVPISVNVEACKPA